MAWFKQIAAVVLMNFRTLPQRLGASLVIVVGMTCVVAVTISFLSMSAGLLQITASTGRIDRAIVTSAGSTGLGGSVSRADALTILDAPHVRKNSEGRSLGSPEVLFPVPVVKISNGFTSAIPLLGIGSQGLALRPEIKLTEGRMFTPALHELIVGQSAPTQYRNLEIGSHVSLPGGYWTVVGRFAAGGSLYDSWLLGDVETVLSAFSRNNFNRVTVQLDRGGSFDDFKSALTTNPSLSVDVLRESDYYYNLSKQINDLISIVAYALGAIMGLGATFGALNTMYSAVSARTLEIATLRAIGFGAGTMVVSIFAEALLLAVTGALIGAAVAWLIFSGKLFAAGPIVLTLAVTPAHFLLGIAFAGLIGLVGGLFPAIQAARLPVATALRAT